ncbi:hypothetical protein DV736_g4167, partial [Chaetothyriales sp. CBS 134916]
MQSHSPLHSSVTYVELMICEAPPPNLQTHPPSGYDKKITYDSTRLPTWTQQESNAVGNPPNTRRTHIKCDGVGVIAILGVPFQGPSLFLQKQFRPPLTRCTMEVPSRLIDEGEDSSAAAPWELKEETGYTATIPGDGNDDSKATEGFIMFNDPGFCNTNTKMMLVDVDMQNERNKNPHPELKENEFIETYTLPLDRLWDELAHLDAEGYGIDARVATLAQGTEMAKRWKGVVLKEKA